MSDFHSFNRLAGGMEPDLDTFPILQPDLIPHLSGEWLLRSQQELVPLIASCREEVSDLAAVAVPRSIPTPRPRVIANGQTCALRFFFAVSLQFSVGVRVAAARLLRVVGMSRGRAGVSRRLAAVDVWSRRACVYRCRDDAAASASVADGGVVCSPTAAPGCVARWTPRRFVCFMPSRGRDCLSLCVLRA
jgi:hypothetical protein